MENQTEELWLTDSDPQDQGTGLFLVQSGHAANLGGTLIGGALSSENQVLLQKSLVENITFADCVKRGTNTSVIAFKWIPTTVASYAAVQSAASACIPTRCVRRCASFGCLCESGSCK